ncbi:MAG: hypothetical protein ACI8P3_002369 [Saprospiraceae bacterium]|jgi:hypothetical protein
MLKIIYLFIVLFIYSNLFAQIESNEYFEVFQTVKEKSYHIYYARNGNFVLNPIDANQKAFLMDTLGNRIELPCHQLKRKQYYDNLDILYCYQDTLVGLFSISKHEFVSPKCEIIHMVNENFYAVQKGKRASLYNLDHKLLLEYDVDENLDNIFQSCDSEHAKIFYKGKQSVINYKGESIKDYPCLLNELILSPGFFLFIENGKYGVKSALGEEILAAKYEHIKEWQDNKFIVSLKTQLKNDEISKRKDTVLKGVFDKSGKSILPIEYEYITSYPYGLICRKPNCETIFLNKSLENIYKRKFDIIMGSKNGFIRFKDGSDTYYDFVYDSLGWVLKDDFVSGNVLTNQISELKFTNGSHVLMNRLGQVIYDPKGENVSYKGINQNYIQVKFEKETGLLNVLGDWLVEPGDYTFRNYKDLGGILVKDEIKNAKTLFSSSGQTIALGVEYGSSIISPKNGYILSKQGKSGVIDDEGNVLIPFNYNCRIREFRQIPGFYLITGGGYSYLVKIKKR